ncbi:MAG: preprotein translocase subunit SecD [Eubacteriales bacterium]|nr:preprotein translocase subunit SecD [Eubacteriales bacterium]MDN5364184.1 preprotein translocase subunit SecD [Eubacteriales bacterium]
MAYRKLVIFFMVVILLSVGMYLSLPLVLKNINLGLDLQGGLHVLYEAQDTPQAKVNDDSINSAIKNLENRVNRFGVKEPIIQRQGKRRIIVEIAGVKDPNEIINTIGRTAFLEFKGPDGKTILTGADLKKAALSYDQSGNPAVSLQFNSEGTRKFRDATAKFLGQPIGIYLDGQLLSNPVVQSVISDGNAQITGKFEEEEAKRLADLLNSGALPVKLVLKEKRVVGPTLGKDSLDKSKVAGVIGVIAILVFMAVYYRLPGLVADFALLVYTFLLLALLAAVGATLTLPGIAGFLLSIGVAVDANVIIFERIKEEIRIGRTLRSAIDAGFSRAFITILDSNAVTIIAGLVLYYFGTGPIRGFAVTLLLGIVASIVTAVFLTRYLLRLLADTPGLDKPFLYGV